MIIEFLEEAEIELFEAAAWYESKETGLGKRFRRDKIIIAAVAHEHRKPGYWKSRT